MFKNLKSTTHEVVHKIDSESTRATIKQITKSACLVIGVNALVHVATSYVDHKVHNI